MSEGQNVEDSAAHSFAEPLDAKKSVARVFGYLGLGLGIAALVAFLVSLAFISIIGPAIASANASQSEIEAAELATTIYLVLLVVSGIALVADSIVMSVKLRNVMLGRSSSNLMVPYILYTVLMGVFLSSLLVTGIDFWTVGEAFAVTALVFGTMFVLGYYSKINLRPVASVLFGLIISLLLTSLIFGLVSLITGRSIVYYALDMAISLLMTIFVLIVVAVDAYNMNQLIKAGRMTKALEIYFAFDMFVDFIYIFLRALRLIIAMKGRR